MPRVVAHLYAKAGVKQLYDWQWRALMQEGPLGVVSFFFESPSALEKDLLPPPPSIATHISFPVK